MKYTKKQLKNLAHNLNAIDVSKWDCEEIYKLGLRKAIGSAYGKYGREAVLVKTDDGFYYAEGMMAFALD